MSRGVAKFKLVIDVDIWTFSSIGDCQDAMLVLNVFFVSIKLRLKERGETQLHYACKNG